MTKQRLARSMLLATACLLLLLAASCSRHGQPTTSPPNAVTVPVALNFFARPGTDPSPRQLNIGVANRISAKWSVRVDQPWLNLEPKSGETPRNFTLALATSRTTVTVDSSTLPAGAYEAAIAITVEGQEARKVPVYLFVTTAQPGQPIDARVEPGQGTAWDSIKLEGPFEVKAASVVDLPLPEMPSLGDSALAYAPGDMDIEISGSLTNTTDRDWRLDYWPAAFDADGAQVAWGLDVGTAPLLGHLQVDIAARSTEPFTLHLSWSDNVSRITVSGNKYEPYTPPP